MSLFNRLPTFLQARKRGLDSKKAGHDEAQLHQGGKVVGTSCPCSLDREAPLKVVALLYLAEGEQLFLVIPAQHLFK